MAQVTLRYEPTARQRAFHASGAFEVLYGGAAGGGGATGCGGPPRGAVGWGAGIGFSGPTLGADGSGVG